jgi:hypothetical protein
MVSAIRVSGEKALEIILTSADSGDESSTDDDENEFFSEGSSSRRIKNVLTKDRDDAASTSDISFAESDVQTFQSQTS